MSEEGLELDALARHDTDAWRALMPVLRRIARELAPSFRDVSTHDDVLGDLALCAREAWIEDWIDRARRGEARVPLGLFLRDRMRDRLREERRRRARRAALLAEGGVPTLIAGSPFPQPDDALAAEELRAQAAGGSPALRTVIGYREQGLDQEEIARKTETSRATVGRRLAVIAAVLAPLVASALVLAWWIGARTGGTEVRAEGAPAIRTDVAPPPPIAPMLPLPEPRTGAAGPIDVGQPQQAIDPEPPSLAIDVPAETPAIDSDGRDRAPRSLGRPDPDARAVPRAATGTGYLMVNSRPWSEVRVDGRRVGNTPIMRLALRPGVHQVELRTADGRVRQVRVTIRSGETQRYVVSFD